MPLEFLNESHSDHYLEKVSSKLFIMLSNHQPKDENEQKN